MKKKTLISIIVLSVIVWGIAIFTAVSLFAWLFSDDEIADATQNQDQALPGVEYDDGTLVESGDGYDHYQVDEGSHFYKKVSRDENGYLNIARYYNDIPMGEDGTWTIMVYLCGSDLESGGTYRRDDDEGGAGTMDIDEMLAVSTGENIRFIVETGGSLSWKNDLISPEQIERYEICDGEITMVDSKPLDNMGEAQALSDFIKWGVKNYPAARMGLILWNHGGGSIDGVCFDELYNGDSLNLKEIEKALYYSSEVMTDRFEFIGFDACLMGTIEVANVLATYSRYMYGSEETIPGFGWDYEALGNYLVDNPNADGAMLGRALCTQYREYYEMIDEYARSEGVDVNFENLLTLSAIDLNKLDGLLTAFDIYASNLYDSTGTVDALGKVVRNVVRADQYGEGAGECTNMVDLGGFIESGDMYTPGISEVMTALDDVVVAKTNGRNHSIASGISIFYPIQVNGSKELAKYGEIATSPNYLAFIDRVMYGSANGGDIGSYSGDSLEEIYDAYYGEEGDAYASETDDLDGGLEIIDPFDEYFEQYDDYKATGESPYVEYEIEPYVDDEGTFGFVLTQDSLEYIADVHEMIYTDGEDDDIICLGESGFVYADWNTGEFTDDFNGVWFGLPDGQIISAYIISEDEDVATYYSPILLNDNETNLLFSYDKNSLEFSIDGIWDGSDDNGMAAHTRGLSKGDVIVPLYMYYTDDSEYDEDSYYYGNEYTVTGSTNIEFIDLFDDSDYYYMFSIDDIFGDYVMTDYTVYSIVDGEIYFDSTR